MYHHLSYNFYSFFIPLLPTDCDDDDNEDINNRILRGGGMSTISISIQFYPCIIISLIITIHFLFLYRRLATDYDNDDSLRCDRHCEGGSGNNTGRIQGLLWGGKR